ncbi:unnamed protein product [Spirodela intermedia]|uniref:Uncharacterized protein n=1 Tax=Spirodela intermedia TaxID=51605 RepID=A0A7I8IXQ6_SPIIN|nr:unnamed protein product [Spirodela intermedia]CAA6661790.1 unnamed protein product [Spirodela intermedia]
MSSTQKEEHGVKSSPWSTSDLAMGVPIKKRRFLFTRSPSPPSQSTAFPADDGKRQSSEITFPIQESCFSQVSGQHHDMGETYSGPISEKNEVGLKLGGRSSGSKLSSNDKSALQSVLANGGFPFPLNLQNEPPLGESIAPSIQQESGHCELELALPERQFNTPSEQGSKFGASLVRQHSSRSHWNLNTTMDTWEGSTVDTTLNRGPVANEDPDLGNGNLNVSEMDSVEKICQESGSALAISWNCGVSGGASSSKLSNTLNLPGETCAVNTDLNLHLNPASGSTSYSNVGVSFSPAILAARKADDLSLSTDFTSLTHGSNLAACGAGSAGKTEPVDGDGDKNSEFMKAGNLESASVRDIKLEVSEAVEQESAKTASLSASGTVCGVGIKLEQLEVPTPDGLSLPQGSSHSLDSPRTLNKEVLPPVANGGGVVDCKNMRQSPLPPNVDEATVPAAKASVPDDTELTVVVEQESAKAASPSISRSPDNTSRHVVSDANESQSIDFPSIRALQEDVKGNANKISELSSEPSPTEENEIGPLKGAEVVDDSKDEEEEVSNAMAEICEQVSHSDDCTGPSGCISVDVTTSDKSTKNGLINAESKPEVKKFEMSEIRNEPLDSHDAVLVKEAVSKLHTDNDDYEDGEFRESLLRGATRVSCTINEKRTVDFKPTLRSDVHARLPSILVGNESTPEKPEELKDVHCNTESSPHPFPVNNAPDSNVSDDVKESSAGHVMAAEPKKRKAMKITRRMPQGLGPGDIIEDLGAQLVKESVDQSSQLKAGVPQNDGADKHASNEECLSRMPRFGKDRDLDQAMQKARSDGLRMRGRISHPLGSPRGGWDTDRGCPSEHFSMPTSCLISGHKRAAEPGFAISTDDIYDSPGRMGRRHMDDDEDDDDDDELKNLTMRDLGPDRRSGGAAGGVSRGFSHHPWRPPRRSPEVFDTRPSLMHLRSPDDMPSRRHISPHFSRLHVPMVDMPRFDFELGSNRRMNPDYAGNFHQPLGDELCPEERRSSDDQPFGRRQQFTGGDDGAGHSRSFIPGPISCPMRGGGDLRNRLGNVHRRLAGMEEQEGDYGRGSGQGWHSGRLRDARLKRRRF